MSVLGMSQASLGIITEDEYNRMTDDQARELAHALRTLRGFVEGAKIAREKLTAILGSEPAVPVTEIKPKRRKPWTEEQKHAARDRLAQRRAEGKMIGRRKKTADPASTQPDHVAEANERMHQVAHRNDRSEAVPVRVMERGASGRYDDKGHYKVATGRK